MATTSPANVIAPKAEEPPVSDGAVVAVTSTPATPPPESDDPKALASNDVMNGTPKDKENGTLDKEAVLLKLGQEKTLSFIKAWFESQKAKVENKAQKRHSKVTSWENSKKASLEAQQKKLEEQLEKKKAEYAEQVKNKEALIHKKAEEKRAMVEAKKGEEMLKVEVKADQYRALGQLPKKAFCCFNS